MDTRWLGLTHQFLCVFLGMALGNLIQGATGAIAGFISIMVFTSVIPTFNPTDPMVKRKIRQMLEKLSREERSRINKAAFLAMLLGVCFAGILGHGPWQYASAGGALAGYATLVIIILLILKRMIL